MSNLFGVLNTGRTGLFAQQGGLAVTGNNIANVNTPGYTRQRAVLESYATGGVQLRGTMRLQDEFALARLRTSNGELAGRAILSVNLSQIESAMSETDSSGIGKALQNFFNAFHDLSQQPGGTPEREAVRSRGQQLASSFASVAGQLQQLRSQIDQQVRNEVEHVNQLAAEIAKINGKIGTAAPEGGMASPEVNNLLDQRDRLTNQLSEIVPLRVVAGAHNAQTLFIGDQVLLEGTVARKLTTTPDASNDGLSEVILSGLGNGVSLGGKLSSGKLGGLLQSRDQEAGGMLRETNRLAALFARDFNVQHRAGTGLDNVTGRNFFTGLQVSGAAAWANRGGAAVTTTAVLDDTQLTFNDYEIRFTTPGQYDVVNATTGAVLSAGNAYVSGNAIDFDGMRVAISNDTGAPAAGDVFRVNSYDNMGGRMDLAAGVAADTRAIAAGQTSAPGDNTNALALVALRDRAAIGAQSYEGFYANLRVKQGMATQSAQQAEENARVANQQLVAFSDSLSGVSLDEEATNLIQFQRAFQASSRVISATDELMQSLLQMI